MAEPSAGETHQLLTTNGNRRQHRRVLDVWNQQTIQKSQDQDAENPKAELKQTQTQNPESACTIQIFKNLSQISLDIKKSIVICSPWLQQKPGN